MQRYWKFNLRLIAALLLLWVLVTFGVPYFSTALHFRWLGGPFSFWMTAQGTLLVYFCIVAVYGWAMNRRDSQLEEGTGSDHA